MSVYLARRLIEQGIVERPGVLAALRRSQSGGTSFLAALLRQRGVSLSKIGACFAADGATAELAWKPDAELLKRLPPGFSEALLAFPVGCAEGIVQVVVVSPLDSFLEAELTFHFRGPVQLVRGDVRVLLAASGLEVPWSLVPRERRIRSVPPIPLVRRSLAPKRGRTMTKPGVGSMGSKKASTSTPSGTAPLPDLAVTSASRVAGAETPVELARALSEALPEPCLVFFVLGSSAILVAQRGTGLSEGEWLIVEEESVLGLAVRDGAYAGPCLMAPSEAPLRMVFSEGTVVRAESIVVGAAVLIVLVPSALGPSRTTVMLGHARRAAARIYLK